jgi:hypothetical protein
MSDPTDEILSISLRSAFRRRDQEAWIADSLPRMRLLFMSANLWGRGVASEPLREAKTEEISPSFLGPLSRGCGEVAVARVRPRDRLAPHRGITRRSVDSIMDLAAI